MKTAAIFKAYQMWYIYSTATFEPRIERELLLKHILCNNNLIYAYIIDVHTFLDILSIFCCHMWYVF